MEIFDTIIIGGGFSGLYLINVEYLFKSSNIFNTYKKLISNQYILIIKGYSQL